MVFNVPFSRKTGENTFLNMYLLHCKLIFSFILAALILHLRTDARLIEIQMERKGLDKICKQSQDYNFCMNTLGTDQRTPSADIYKLALISISLTITQIQDTSARIPEIIKNIPGTDPVGKKRIGICQSDYSDALVQFQGAHKSADTKSYMDVINWVRDGTNKVIECENNYRRDPIRECPVTVDNHNVIKLSEIILIIVDSLIPH